MSLTESTLTECSTTWLEAARAMAALAATGMLIPWVSLQYPSPPGISIHVTCVALTTARSTTMAISTRHVICICHHLDNGMGVLLFCHSNSFAICSVVTPQTTVASQIYSLGSIFVSVTARFVLLRRIQLIEYYTYILFEGELFLVAKAALLKWCFITQ